MKKKVSSSKTSSSNSSSSLATHKKKKKDEEIMIALKKRKHEQLEREEEEKASIISQEENHQNDDEQEGVSYHEEGEQEDDSEQPQTLMDESEQEKDTFESRNKKKKVSEENRHQQKHSFLVDALNVTKNIHISPIKRLCLNPGQTMLAVARFNSEIEIWSLDNSVFNRGTSNSSEKTRNMTPSENCALIKRIPGKIGTTVEAMIWTKNNQLFTAGLHGMITEWDLEKQIPKRISTAVLGGAIWAMDYCEEKNLIAIACEDGAVRLIQEEDLSLKFFLAPARTNEPPSGKKYAHCQNSHRMLTTKFIDNGNKILVGGMTGVFCFDLNKRTLIYKINLKNSFCWCMEILNDRMIVVGDSEGNIHFCDYVLGAIVNSIKGHTGDVLKICIEKPGIIYSTGVDGSIAMYKEVGKKYVFVIRKRPSLHDLCDIIYCEKEKTLYFGGLNSAILRMKTEIFYRQQDLKDKIFDRLRIKPNRDVLKVAHERRVALFDNMANTLTLLHLPEPTVEYRRVSLDEPASILMQLKVKSKGNWYSSRSEISPNGKYICVSSIDSTYLIKLKYEESSHAVTLEKKLNLSEPEYGITPGHYAAFAGNQYVVVVARDCSTMQIFDVENETLISSVQLSTKIDTNLERSDSPFALFSNSINGLIANEKYIVVSKGNVFMTYRVEDLSSQKNKVHFEVELPTHNGFLYKLDFLDRCNSKCSSFYSLTSPNTITVFEADRRRTMVSPLNFPSEKLNQSTITSIHQISPDHFFITSLNRCFIMNTNTYQIKDYVLSSRKGKSEDMVGFAHVNTDELLMACFDYKIHTEELLPPVIDRKRFGT
ncbi:hypothetical protein FDP41_013147 [Naegleria fowleri]|uniref:Uncharacterized protein n=1 Tax=Naegleria fowleri TaxID=5763 RepID=A0A6A5C287_NAEFO|nr:uncharacterized protein FDP41_013147 [Naegleria fowleri]KAF0980664.1 hypothetical protein FDP41_013147 [Naegleria fowleri]